MMWPEFWVYCRNGAQDCYRTVQENQGYGFVTVYLQRFYQAYSADTLDKYFDAHKEDFLTLFPDIETHQPGAVDSLADGHFLVTASAIDSSILVFRDKNSGPVLSNLVFAIERADN